MSKKLFENYNEKAYENTTDPYASILEGPKFTFGNSSDSVSNGESEESEELGRDLKGNPTRRSHDMTEEEIERLRKNAEKDDAAEEEYGIHPLTQEEPKSDLERWADAWLDPEVSNSEHRFTQDALNHVDDIGDFDIAVDFEGPDYSVSGKELVPPTEEPLEMDSEEQFGLDNPEGVLGEEEPIIPEEEPAGTPAKDLIALSNVSDEELMKELQFRMANKAKV